MCIICERATTEMRDMMDESYRKMILRILEATRHIPLRVTQEQLMEAARGAEMAEAKAGTLPEDPEQSPVKIAEGVLQKISVSLLLDLVRAIERSAGADVPAGPENH